MVVCERAASGQLVIGMEPVIQQDSGRVSNTLVPASFPSLHRFTQCRNTNSGLEPGGDVQQLSLRRVGWFLLFARHGFYRFSFTVTSNVLVVSLPKISITFTMTAYLPGAEYLYAAS